MQVEGLTIDGIKLEKILNKLGKDFDLYNFGRLSDLCLSGSRLVGVVFVGVNLVIYTSSD